MGYGKTIVVNNPTNTNPSKFINMPVANNSPTVTAGLDFTFAAEKTLPAAVHIQSSKRVKQRSRIGQGFDLEQIPEEFRDFFGHPFGDQRPNQQNAPEQMQQASGSGVIISSDGYIVTNNHVIADADELTVTLNDHRTYTATVIGTDPSTDVALIKIEENNLPLVQFANSDAIKVGEWVVAVGNPFNLESTVTAGIVSAKGRSINIMQDKTPIESFIQTDAAINPGNSGGALVNLSGELVGVNTAIASPTGSYAGYGFAVPSNIVVKIISDLKDFGVVQRGFIGAMIRNIDGKFAKEKGLTTNTGVYVDSLTENSAAADAGMKTGDIIIAVDGISTSTSPKLMEMIGRHRPGDMIPLTIQRNGKEKEIMVTLKNSSGNTEVIKKEQPAVIESVLGASFEPIKKEEAKKMGIPGGVKITDLHAGKLANQTDVREGFVITKIDDQEVNDLKDISKILESKKGGVMIEGKYPGSDQIFYYAFGL
jgi:Do/DeqQ family serine protease